MDQIISIANREHPDLEVKYSTVNEYFGQLEMTNVDWPVYTQDLNPYLTDQSEYWSGYYTTDSSFKQRVSSFSQIVRSTLTISALQVLAGAAGQHQDNFDQLRETAAINLHHDATTGTHFPEVGYSYDSAMLAALNSNSKYLNEWAEKEAMRQGLLIEGFKMCYAQIQDAVDRKILIKDS